MSNKDNISIVIPCYNEAVRLPRNELVIFLDKHPEVHLILVDDGSSDATGELLRKLSSEIAGRIHVVDHSANRGKGEAVRSGIKYALEKNSPKWVAYLDADLSTPPDEIMRLCEEAGSRQFVMASRIKLLGARIHRRAWRHYVGRVLATLVDSTFHFGVYDTQCGAKVIKADLASEIFRDPFITRWLFDVELLCRIARLYGKENLATHVIEVPVRQWTDKGNSRVKWLDGLKVPWQLWRIKRQYKI